MATNKENSEWLKYLSIGFVLASIGISIAIIGIIITKGK